MPERSERGQRGAQPLVEGREGEAGHRGGKPRGVEPAVRDGPRAGRMGERDLVGHQAANAFTTSANDRLSPVATSSAGGAGRIRPAMSPATSST